MDKKLKKLIKNRDFWLVIIILVFGFYTGFFKDLFNSSLEKIELIFAPTKVAVLEINYGDRRRAFEGEIMFDMSILDALLAASRGGNFEIRYAILGDKADIMKINGLIEDGLNEKRWSFYLNGQKIESSEIHKTLIKPGDKILVNFE